MMINRQFVVNPDESTITDLFAEAGSSVVKLEPRIMKLLLMLIEAEGRLVTRGEIISQVWDNYGGADEGLNQAISFLRKTLNDRDKTLIKTIPTKGYMLVAEKSKEKEVATHSVKPVLNKAVYIAGLAVLITMLFFLPRFFSKNPSGPVEPPGTVIDTGHPSEERREQELKKGTGGGRDSVLDR